MDWGLLAFGLADTAFGAWALRSPTTEAEGTTSPYWFQKLMRILVGGVIFMFGVYTIIAALTGLPHFMATYSASI